MTPLTITAFMGSSPMLKEPPRIDAVLYFATGRRLGFASPDRIVPQSEVDATPLPLARVETASGWWYAASQATPWGTEEPVYTHKRAPLQQAVMWTTQKSINVAAGPDKSLRKRSYCRPEMMDIRWHCVGDKAEICALLAIVPGIGAQTTHGYGWVRDWRVEDGGPPLEAYRSSVDLRHIPVAEIGRFPTDGAFTVRQMPLRPPYWSRDGLVSCVVRPFLEATP